MHQLKRQSNCKTVKKYGFKRNFLLILAITAIILSIGLTHIGVNPVSVKAATVKLNKTKETMWVGDTLKLKLKNNKRKIKWSSSKKSVASVSSKGIVKAKTSGKAVITAKVKSKRYKCTVTVRKMTISKSTISLVEGNSAELYLKYPKQEVKWTTSDSSVAYVKGKKVFGVAAGNAVVTAKCAGKSYSCKVEVLPKEPAITVEEPVTVLSADKLTMAYGSSMPLTLNNSKGKVAWISSDKNIAYADGQYVYGKSVGEATITALCNGLSYSCNVTVVSGETEQLEEGGIYTGKDKVALYIHTYQKLPCNFITKDEAKALGWSGGSLLNYAPSKCIGGDKYSNYESSLPKKENRQYYECDINTLGAQARGAERLVYSNDGLIYYTPDHYNTFVLLYE